MVMGELMVVRVGGMVDNVVDGGVGGVFFPGGLSCLDPHMAFSQYPWTVPQAMLDGGLQLTTKWALSIRQQAKGRKLARCPSTSREEMAQEATVCL